MTAPERKYEEGRRAGLLEAAQLLSAWSDEAFKEGSDTEAEMWGGGAGELRALAGPAQARLDGGEACDARAELIVRTEIVLNAHLDARAKFWTDPVDEGGRGSVYQRPGVAALDEARKEIRAALVRHHETNGDRERWRRESAVLAAGVGIFYSEPHNGELERRRFLERRRDGLPPGWLPKLYLELWRPWKLQRGKPDPVLGFAELCFERRREVARGR